VTGGGCAGQPGEVVPPAAVAVQGGANSPALHYRSVPSVSATSKGLTLLGAAVRPLGSASPSWGSTSPSKGSTSHSWGSAQLTRSHRRFRFSADFTPASDRASRRLPPSTMNASSSACGGASVNRPGNGCATSAGAATDSPSCHWPSNRASDFLGNPARSASAFHRSGDTATAPSRTSAGAACTSSTRNSR